MSVAQVRRLHWARSQSCIPAPGGLGPSPLSVFGDISRQRRGLPPGLWAAGLSEASDRWFLMRGLAQPPDLFPSQALVPRNFSLFI